MEELFNDILKTKPYTTEYSGNDVMPHDTLGKTMPYHSPDSVADFPTDELATQAYPTEKPIVQRTLSHKLGIGDSIQLNSLNYKILEIISGEGKTAEAVIYKVQDQNQRIFVLKLYYEFNDEHLEPNSDTLQRIREIGGKDILHLFDFGTGPNKHLNKYCFEITDFAAGFDLTSVADFHEKYTPEFIEKKVVRAIYNGLQTLHSQKIYHCDLKPQNVFYLDKAQTQLVIGDYGSAKSFEKSSEKELSYTTITRGTEFYLAPEQAFGIVSEKNDFYSLGMIALHLLYPEQVSHKNLRRIFERRTKGLPIIDFDPKHQRLNKLIEGLTLQDYNNRWGANEIKRWMSAEEVAVHYGVKSDERLLKIAEKVIRSGKELSLYIESDQRFFDELIMNREGYSHLLDWIKNLMGTQNMTQFDTMITYYKKYFGIDYVKETMLFYFDPDHQIAIGTWNFKFTTEGDIRETSAALFEIIDELWKISDFETLRLYFFRYEYAIRRLRVKADKATVNIIDTIFKTLADIVATSYEPDFSDLKANIFIHIENQHLPDLFYYFNPERKFKDLRGNEFSTSYEVCQLLKTSPTHKDDFMQLEKEAFLKHLPKDDFLEFLEFSDHIIDFFLEKNVDLEILIRLIVKFTSETYEPSYVREFVQNYRKANIGIIKDVIRRLINPETPISFKGKNIYLYKDGNFEGKIEDFFTALEELKINASFQSAVQALFSLEFSLMQLAQKDKATGKKLIEPVFQKINTIFHGSLPDSDKLKAVFYKQLTEKNLLDLLYKFNPSRVFRTHTGKSLGTIQDIGLYYIQHPEQFEMPSSIIERTAYFTKTGYRGLVNMEFKPFILKIFQSQITFDAQIKEILYDQTATNQVSIYYYYQGSIDGYLKSVGLQLSISDNSEKLQSINIQKKTFESNDELYENFANKLQGKHNFGTLTPETRTSFDKAMLRVNKLDFYESFFLLPRYLLYLLPLFGIIYLGMSYMIDGSPLRQVLLKLSPTFSFIALRIPSSYYAVSLLTAYFLNISILILLLIPLFSLKRKQARYEQFVENYSSLLNKLVLIMLYAPLLFTGIYALWGILFEDFQMNSHGLNLQIGSLDIAVFFYITFMFYETLKIVKAFFKVSKKIRIVPLIAIISLYLILGFITLFNY